MSDLSLVTNLPADLKTVNGKFAASIRKNIRAVVTRQGAVVVDAVRERASWSTRIPNAVGISTRFNRSGTSVKIRVDHTQAPHARPLEKGNRDSFDEAAVNKLGGYKTVNGRRVAVNRSAYKAIRVTGIGLSRVLRHPVFHATGAPGGYAEMATRPFFKPGVDASVAGIKQDMAEAVVKIAHDAGFK